MKYAREALSAFSVLMNFMKEIAIGDHYLKNDVIEFHVSTEGAVQLDSPSFKLVDLFLATLPEKLSILDIMGRGAGVNI